jgi:hypothetical protein
MAINLSPPSDNRVCFYVFRGNTAPFTGEYVTGERCAVWGLSPGTYLWCEHWVPKSPMIQLMSAPDVFFVRDDFKQIIEQAGFPELGFKRVDRLLWPDHLDKEFEETGTKNIVFWELKIPFEGEAKDFFYYDKRLLIVSTRALIFLKKHDLYYDAFDMSIHGKALETLTSRYAITAYSIEAYFEQGHWDADMEILKTRRRQTDNPYGDGPLPQNHMIMIETIEGNYRNPAEKGDKRLSSCDCLQYEYGASRLIRLAGTQDTFFVRDDLKEAMEQNRFPELQFKQVDGWPEFDHWAKISQKQKAVFWEMQIPAEGEVKDFFYHRKRFLIVSWRALNFLRAQGVFADCVEGEGCGKAYEILTNRYAITTPSLDTYFDQGHWERDQEIVDAKRRQITNIKNC